MRLKSGAVFAGAIMAAAAGLGGCATKDFVLQQFGTEDQKVSANQARIDQHDAQMAKLDKTSREALERADAAGKLAQGKFVYQIVLQDDSVKFAANSAQISPEAQARLMDFVQKLKSENKNVYVEIQGHTDHAERRRAGLGEARAEAVRRFMSQQGVPLSRISTISYGDTTPATTDASPAGRAQNRRVVLIVVA
jgi:outer membrane protein OmpA-like peptidoglycan-associated protein